MTDPLAERIRKIGGTTLRSIGHIGRTQRIQDNDADYVQPLDMLAELREDNKMLAASLREAHNVTDEHRDIASSSLIENWIDETEKRAVPVRGQSAGRRHRALSAPAAASVTDTPGLACPGSAPEDLGQVLHLRHVVDHDVHAVRMAHQIVLVIVLGAIEGLERFYRGGHRLAVTPARFSCAM